MPGNLRMFIKSLSVLGMPGNLRIFVKKLECLFLLSLVIYECMFTVRIFVPAKPFQPNLIFAGKTKRLPKSGALKTCFSRACFVLTCRQYTRVERLTRSKHSSPLRTIVNYIRETYYKHSTLGTIYCFWYYLHFFRL